MKEEYISYAKRLDTIGDLIIAISNIIGKAENFNDLEVAIDRYKYAVRSLADVKYPEIIESEHKRLVLALNEWVIATEQLKNSKNNIEVKQGISLQKQKEKNIELITKEIGDIFLKT